MTGKMLIGSYGGIAVTGGNGWLGRRVVQALTEGLADLAGQDFQARKVVCLVQADQRADALRDLDVEIVAGDIRDPEACRALVNAAGREALVLHIAGVIHPGSRTRDFEAVNVKGSLNVFNAARDAGALRVVALSSNSPFGANATPEGRFNEDSSYRPYMGYGRSKYRMECLLRDGMRRPASPGLVLVRAPWFYGPGQPQRQTQFFTMIRRGGFPLLGGGRAQRSMAYVDSLALGILLAATKAEADGRAYWIADERPYPMHEIVETVKSVLQDDFGMDVSPRNLILPSVVADGARLADSMLQGVGLYHQKIHVLSEMNLTIACDIAKASKDLGYRPLVELREGMRRSVAWCLENGQSI